MTDSNPQETEQQLPFPASQHDDNIIIIDGCGHNHYRQEFRFEGRGFFGRMNAAVLNWMRRNSD